MPKLQMTSQSGEVLVPQSANAQQMEKFLFASGKSTAEPLKVANKIPEEESTEKTKTQKQPQQKKQPQKQQQQQQNKTTGNKRKRASK